ncbi:MAG: ribonuclease H family protein, partial [Candidatus Absconditabacteria bacterium]
MKKEKKYYVIWEGEKTGIFDNWEDCKNYVIGVKGSKYKSFTSLNEAKIAFENQYEDYKGTSTKPTLTDEQIKFYGKPIMESICVDGAWNTENGLIEYQCVKTDTKELLFHKGPFEDGTNNIAEFLGLVHACAYCQKHKIKLPIYSDSRTAISWVRKMKANTKHKKSSKNEQLFDLISRAESWLEQNKIQNRILKWETVAWGEIPADFG